MAPSIISLGTAALALAGNAAAKKWYLEDKYDSSNFFDKFVFNTASDPNSGYVTYRNQTDAVELGIASVSGGEVKLGVDNKSVLSQDSPGRSSVRLESHARFDKNLIVARFSHLPESKCSAWPALLASWTVGDAWPTDGEVDMLESWNMDSYNKPAYHMGNPGLFGQCTLDGAGQSAVVHTKNCDNGFQDVPRQWPNQGCVGNDLAGPHASHDGGVYAMEWTKDFIKVYSWRNGAAPSNIGSDAPDTSSWGTPTMHLKSSSCDIDKVFKNQRLIVNIALCGNPVGDSPGPWDQCKAVTKSTCADYVRYNPSAFDNVYFKIKDIRVFGQNPPQTTTTSTTSTISKETSTSSTEPTTSGTSSSSTLSSTEAAVVPDATSTAPSWSTDSTIEASTSSATGASSKTAYAASTSSTTTYEAADTTSVLNTSTKDVSTTTPAATEFAAASVIANASAPGIISSTTTRQRFNSPMNNSNVTTSTVYTTAIHTITSCEPTITNCPIGKMTTLTIPLYTTVCPVSGKPTQAPGSGHGDKTTITTKLTKTYAITSCAPAVTDCPGGGFTTQSPFHPIHTSKKTTVFHEAQAIVVPKPVLPGGGQNGTTNATTIVKPRPSANGSVNTQHEQPVPRPTADNICPGPDCPPPTGISGASSAQGIGLAMLIGGLAAVLL
ncbi:hypothetical protein EsHS_00002618 [Epichloe bromicola]